MDNPFKPSEAFDRAFGSTGGGTCGWVECECGRQHHSDVFLTQYAEDEEIASFNDFKEMALEKPDQYILWESEWISHYNFGGMPVVWGCPCKGSIKLENWIFYNRDGILRYLAGIATNEYTIALLTDQVDSYLKERKKNADKAGEAFGIAQQKIRYRF